MELAAYFETDNGSLPELEFKFTDQAQLVRAFEHLFACGARDLTNGRGAIWIGEELPERSFVGPEDAKLVMSGQADSFHVVLQGIMTSNYALPDLGVEVSAECIVFDYKMGVEWGPQQIEGIIRLSQRICSFGGSFATPWWGESGQRAFLAAIESLSDLN